MPNPFSNPLQKIAQPKASDNPFAKPTPDTVAASVRDNPFAAPADVRKVAEPVDAGFDATPWGMFVNYLEAVPEETARLLKEIGQTTARVPLEAVLSLQQALGGVSDWMSGEKDRFQNLEPIPTEGLTALLGEEPLKGWAPKVADLEQSIKNSRWMRERGIDKAALPLAFGLVVGGEGLNFLGLGPEEQAGKRVFAKAIDYLVKADEKMAYDFLTNNGIADEIAREAAPHLGNTIDRNEIENTLKGIEALQGVLDKQVPRGIPQQLPDHITVSDEVPPVIENIRTLPEIFQMSRRFERQAEGGYVPEKVEGISAQFDISQIARNPVEVGIFDRPVDFPLPNGATARIEANVPYVVSGHNRLELLKRNAENIDDPARYIRVVRYEGTEEGVRSAVRDSIMTNVRNKSIKDIEILDNAINGTIGKNEIARALDFDTKKSKYFNTIIESFTRNDLIDFWNKGVAPKLAALKNLDWGVLQERLNFVERIARKTGDAVRTLDEEQAVAVKNQVADKIAEFLETSKVATLASVERNIARVLDAISSGGFKNTEMTNLFGDVVKTTEVQKKVPVQALEAAVEEARRSQFIAPEIAARLAQIADAAKDKGGKLAALANTEGGLTKTAGKTKALLKRLVEMPEEELAKLTTRGGETLQRKYGSRNLSPEDKEIEREAFAYIEERGMDDIVQEYVKKHDNVVNTDEAREFFEAYRADRTKSAAVHEPSSLIKNAVYDYLLETMKGKRNNQVLYTAGGTGAGKSTGLEKIGELASKYAIVVDSNLNTLSSAMKNIDKALQNGYEARIYYTYNDIEKAFENALARAMSMAKKLGSGRTVPISEHIKTHIESLDTFPMIIEKHIDNPKMKFGIIDNSGDSPRFITELDEMLDFIDKKQYTGSYEELVSKLEKRTRAAAAEGRITGDIAKGFLGKRRELPKDGAGDGLGTEIADEVADELPRGTTVGEGTPAFDSAADVRKGERGLTGEKGQRQIRDNIPLPPTVGEIIARDGRAIPIEKTPMHTMAHIGGGKDGKTWQSLTKGYLHGASPNKKAHWFDGLRTPEFVLEKVGLARGAELLQEAKDTAATTLRGEFETITKWIDRVANQQKDGQVHTYNDTSTLIFDWLDGHERDVAHHMTDAELEVAREIREYLKQWADRLGLPEDARISKYITHIFERGVEGKESVFKTDPELMEIMAENVAKSVYDPFLQKRLGKEDYIHDVWRALDAYVKRASRKEAYDPALKELSDMAEQLDETTFKYVKRLADRVNMRPTELEQGLDSFVTQTPIGHYFTDRPTTFLSKKMRQIWYRGTLGLNIGSATRNLTQGANTYAKLGEKYTILGYTKLFQRMATRDLQELYDQNVMLDSLVQDRQMSATKRIMQGVDNTLFAFFQWAELINRGAAYFGAKAKGLGEGLSEEEAIKYAKRIVRETQFAFSAVDTPVWLNDDIKKTLFQLQTYNIKQTEFLGRMVNQRDIAGMVRWSAASFAMLYTIGKLFGMTANQIIPTFGIGGAPITSTALALSGVMSDDPYTHAKSVSQLQRNFFALIPAGVQIRKTVQGADALARGGSYTDSGKFRYRVGPEDAWQALIFGPSALPQAREYYDKRDKKSSSSDGGNPFAR